MRIISASAQSVDCRLQGQTVSNDGYEHLGRLAQFQNIVHATAIRAYGTDHERTAFSDAIIGRTIHQDPNL